MVLTSDSDLRTHLENGLAINVSAYVENKLKRFGLYRRTTIHSGTPVAQKAFGNRIKCLDTLLRESGKLLVSKLPITALSRDESYDMHLKDILKAEWSTYGILVVDNEGRKHRDYYIAAFLGAADVRTSVQKIYHKSRLELYEELQNTIKIMPSVSGRRLSCSRNDSEELYRLTSFADHMSRMKDLFRLQSGLDTRSFQKNEAPYGPWENLVESLHFLVSDEASCMRMVNEYYSSSEGKYEFLVAYLNEEASRGKFITDIYHHPAMSVLELLRVSGPDINLLGDGNTQGGGSLCPIDFFFRAVGVNLIATLTYFLQKMVLFGGSIIGENTLKDFFYPESGLFNFKPGEGLGRCTRYVIEDLRRAFPSATAEEDSDFKFSVVSRRRFQIIALLSKFFMATRGSSLELQPHERNPSLRGSSVDFDFESNSSANPRKRRMTATLDPNNTSGPSSNIALHTLASTSSIDIMHFSSEIDGHSTLHGLSSRRSVSVSKRLDASQEEGGSLHVRTDNPSESCSSVRDIESDRSHVFSDVNTNSISIGENQGTIYSTNSNSSSEDRHGMSLRKKNDVENQCLKNGVSGSRDVSLNGGSRPNINCSDSGQSSVSAINADIIGSDSSVHALEVEFPITENEKSADIEKK